MDSEENPIFKTRPTVDNYSSAVQLVLGRLRWDLNYKSWISRKRFKQSRDVYAGQKCVILCNGPSLNKVDFDLLSKSGVYTIGLNKINLLFERSSFRPSCIVSVNPLVIEQNAHFYNSTDIPLYLSSRQASFIKLRDNVTFFFNTRLRQFARDCSLGVSGGFTVTYTAMQIAFHLGFRQVALVGCDHSFASSGPANMTVKSGEKDESHFDPRYFSGGMKWQLPDLAGSEYSYSLAGRTFEAFGGSVVNCTEGGKLELYEKLPLIEFLK